MPPIASPLLFGAFNRGSSTTCSPQAKLRPSAQLLGLWEMGSTTGLHSQKLMLVSQWGVVRTLHQQQQMWCVWCVCGGGGGGGSKVLAC